MTPTHILGLLAEMGLPLEVLQSATSDWRVRADLGLSSAETLNLQLILEQFGCNEFSLWDKHDYSLEELQRLIASAAAIAPDVPLARTASGECDE